MSVECIHWVGHLPITAAEGKFCLFMLANWSRADGTCWSPQTRLAQWTGQDEKTVRRHMAKLEAGGYIRRYERRDKLGRRKSDGYMLDPDDKFGLKEWLDTPREADDLGKAKGLPFQEPYRAECPLGPSGQSDRSLPDKLPGIHKKNDQRTINEPEAPPAGPPRGGPHQGELSIAKSPPKRRAGTRLDPNRRPSPKDRQAAFRLGFSEPEIEGHYDRFRNHYAFGPGRNQTWSDWHRAWVNWIKRETPMGERYAGQNDRGRDRPKVASVVGAGRRALGQG